MLINNKPDQTNMKITSIAKAITLASVMIFPMTNQALGKEKKKLPDHNLSEWTFGDTLFGDEPTKTKLKGKVVVVEYWGIK